MKVTLPHNGTKAEARERIKKLLEDSRAKIRDNATDIKEEWDGDTLRFGFSAQGQHIEGTLDIRDNEYELYAKLPLALRLFEGTIERMIHAEAKKMRI